MISVVKLSYYRIQSKLLYFHNNIKKFSQVIIPTRIFSSHTTNYDVDFIESICYYNGTKDNILITLNNIDVGFTGTAS